MFVGGGVVSLRVYVQCATLFQEKHMQSVKFRSIIAVLWWSRTWQVEPGIHHLHL